MVYPLSLESYQLMKKLMLPALMGLLLGQSTMAASEDLSKTFPAPPDSAKPSGWWFWFYNLMDKEGITRDLTEFKAKGPEAERKTHTNIPFDKSQPLLSAGLLGPLQVMACDP